MLFCLFCREKPGNGEKCCLQDSADFVVQPDFLADTESINEIDGNFVCPGIIFKGIRQELFQRLAAVSTV